MAASMESEMLTSALFILNIFCVVPCVVIKLPQLWSLYTSKTARGISFTSILLELFGHTVHLLYMFVFSRPVMQYAEYIFLVAQEWMVILMILHYSHQLDFHIITFSSLYFIATQIIGGDMTPRWFTSLLLAVATSISASSCIFQIMAIYRSKNSGSVSFLSWFLAWATGFLRIISLLVTGDMLVLSSYVIINCLRFIGCAAILYYRPSAKKFK